MRSTPVTPASARLALTIAIVAACARPPQVQGRTPDPTLPGVATPSAELDHELRAALASKGPGYRPRTRHLDGAVPRYVNRLIRETSPYLLQHAHNPMNWYAWGDEALGRARREHKPIFLSIGYSTCHWCHVMERESFEDEEVARALNASFVCIKVDREERPDLDQVYMAAIQAMTGSGGWPMTTILAPDGKPFFGGTYFPRDQLLAIVREVDDKWRRDPAQLTAAGDRVAVHLVAANARPAPSDVPPPQAIVDAVRARARGFDRTWGGSGSRTKFPEPPLLDLLLRYHRRTGDATALDHVVLTLERMAAGGIRDHVGGGFHRYATDREWRVPHFEKMLYDNAQLASVYLDAASAARRDDFAVVATEILDYLMRDMTSPQGGLWSATDADSPGPGGEELEGYAFTWAASEIEAAAGSDAPALIAFYDVAGAGELAGRHVLHVPRSASEIASALSVTEESLRDQLARGRRALFAARARRPQPHLDDKILAGWNGLAISAFARGALARDRPDYVRAARQAAAFVLAQLRGADGRLHRSYGGGRASHAGTLEDYAFVIQGLLDLFEATMEPRWLDDAIALQGQQDAHFLDPAGGYFDVADDAEQLLVRGKSLDDGVEPSGNAIAIRNLLRLELVTDDRSYRTRAQAALAAFAAELLTRGAGSPAALASLERFYDRPLEIVLIGARDRSELKPLRDAVERTYVPNRMLATAVEGPELASLIRKIPALEDKQALHGAATAFVCEQHICRRPTADPAELVRQLAQRTPLVPAPTPAPP